MKTVTLMRRRPSTGCSSRVSASRITAPAEGGRVWATENSTGPDTAAARQYMKRRGLAGCQHAWSQRYPQCIDDLLALENGGGDLNRADGLAGHDSNDAHAGKSDAARIACSVRFRYGRPGQTRLLDARSTPRQSGAG
ncbi:MAG: hypothetical protein HND48_17440 [Chloroflexi bacterium]|nr:hypothetical protein [Chloroflexota bacterium]